MMTSSILELIKFRSLADSSSDKEFDVFISKLFNKLKSLFHLFEVQNHQNQNISNTKLQLPYTINIISSITQSRNNTSAQLSDRVKSTIISKKPNHTPLSLANLPSVLIGFCGSYLSFTDYHSFEKCSRQIYIGCNNQMFKHSQMY